jgi:mitochondrial import inner membrane translocase subunit TIM23
MSILTCIQGVDPLFFYGFCTVGCVGTHRFERTRLVSDLFIQPGAGALIGPSIGGFFWRITHRQTMSLIEAREREFFRRIQKNRADPTAQSATNPVPDFYGSSLILGVVLLLLKSTQAKKSVRCMTIDK